MRLKGLGWDMASIGCPGSHGRGPSLQRTRPVPTDLNARSQGPAVLMTAPRPPLA